MVLYYYIHSISQKEVIGSVVEKTYVYVYVCVAGHRAPRNLCKLCQAPLSAAWLNAEKKKQSIYSTYTYTRTHTHSRTQRHFTTGIARAPGYKAVLSRDADVTLRKGERVFRSARTRLVSVLLRERWCCRGLSRREFTAIFFLLSSLGFGGIIDPIVRWYIVTRNNIF